MKLANGTVLVALVAAFAFARPQQVDTNAQRRSIRSELENQLTEVERELVPAVEAMPEEKFAFVPSTGEYKGVRNFSEQAKHVAVSNFFYFAGFSPEKPPASIRQRLVREVFLSSNENGPAEMSSKGEISKLLRDSFAYAQSAVATITDANALETVGGDFGRGTRLNLTVGAIAHCMDHYGQIVEYLRLNGIIPPASR